MKGFSSFFMIPYFIAPPSILFHEEFMKKDTDFLSWKAMRIAYKHEDHLLLTIFIDFDSDKWNQFVKERTYFSDWSEMLKKAEEGYLERYPYGPFNY
ncbi:hypothetical protein [Alkalihalobacillus trypoxylicola]|uniref:Uncharacterized protein n=1 Tax=Alkalihalobacillus trypoxylicola TaxID=519424 RepID=A0A162F575_9BACI|nr:hypothetical protein [Alkalihalobacillus trypoxylicola]KYG34819.1 hypothetical protein AZF04_00340 [Alkalihalobacillus trypoxylicola]